MTRVHYLQFESDATDLGGLLAAIGRGLSQAAEVTPQPAAAPRLLSAGRGYRPARSKPAKQKTEELEASSRPVNGAHKAAREPEEEPGRKGQMSRLIRKALGEGPKRSREIGEWIRTHGLPKYTNGRASSVLTYLRHRGRVERGKDELWRLKG